MKRTVCLAVIYIATWAGLTLWMQASDAHGRKSRSVQETPSFFKTYEAFEWLCKSSVGTRDDWHRVIKSFLAIHQARQESSARGLLFAGRASLALHRRSGNIEDLDNAVRYLEDFVSANGKSPYILIGSRELKKAQHRRARNVAGSKQVSEPTSFAQVGPSSAASELLEKSQEIAVPVAPLSVVSVSPSATSPVLKCDPKPSSQRSRPIHAGNPYFLQMNRSTVGYQSIVMTASVPPATITDGLRPSQVTAAKPKGFVVVIDPGHGGKDPGAVSQDGRIKEKHLTLDIAKRLKRRLEGLMPGSRVILTRTDDSYMTLSQRTSFANSLNADLFLSIHGNGFGDSRAKGIETFYLSKASSQGSMRVAARENGIPLSRMSDLEVALLDLMVISKKSESDALARTVHSSLARNVLRRDPSARDRGVKTAPFYVLLGAKMPSILVECAFISNGRDRDRLGSLDQVDLIADGIAHGAVKYLGSPNDRG